jgi:hypothetical protein
MINGGSTSWKIRSNYADLAPGMLGAYAGSGQSLLELGKERLF